MPYGETSTYGGLAQRIDRPSARAVGGALNRNPIPIVLPCHRVVGSTGSLVGYAGGLEIKRPSSTSRAGGRPWSERGERSACHDSAVRLLALALVVAALAGCGEDDPATTAARRAGIRPRPRGRESLVIQTDGGPVEVHAEIADSESERETGLMNRTSLDEDGGMLFVFDEDIQAAFWMKDTLILSDRLHRRER